MSVNCGKASKTAHEVAASRIGGVGSDKFWGRRDGQVGLGFTICYYVGIGSKYACNARLELMFPESPST